MHDMVHRGAPAEVGPIGVADLSAPPIVVPLGAMSEPDPLDGVDRDDPDAVHAALQAADRDRREREYAEKLAAPARQRQPIRFADHAKSRNIDALSHEELRIYAREIGVSRRDCEGLTLDRLRQNAKAQLAHHFDLILG